MDPKLRKLLEKSIAVPARDLPDEELYAEIALSLRSEANRLLTLPSGSDETAVVSGIVLQMLKSVAAGTIWYVLPSVLLTPFRGGYLKTAMGVTNVSVMSRDVREGATGPVVLWSSDVLRSRLAELERLPGPSLVVFGNAEYMSHPVYGPIMEEIVLCLPEDVPMLLCMTAVSNAQEVASWLEAARKRPCRLFDPGLPPHTTVPAFISSQWEILPLLEKKHLTGRVKRLLKEEPPFRNPKSYHFVQRLLSLLREERLCPAVVLMPSEEDCDEAAGACTSVVREVGDVLTEPRISAFLDKYPHLKDYPFFSDTLSKRAAPLHCGHHPLWCEFVEQLLSLGSVDVVFTVIDAAEGITAGVRSAVFRTSGQEREGGKPREITRWEAERIKGVVGRKGRGESGTEAGCIAVAHALETDEVLLKDFLLMAHSPVESVFRCDFPVVLGLLANGHGGDPAEMLERSLLAVQGRAEEEPRLEEVMKEITDELPEALCVRDVRAVTSLIDIRQRLVVRIGELESGLKRPLPSRKKLWWEEELRGLEKVLTYLPCEACPHFSYCHKRGYRRFRLLLDEYHAMRDRVRKSLTGLKADFEHVVRCLEKFGLVDLDEEHRLGPSGVLALATGLEMPLPLIECLRERVLPMTESAFYFPVIGGFVEGPERDRPWMAAALQEEAEELMPAYEKMEPVLTRTMKRLLRFGILAPDPFLAQSAVLLASKRGKQEKSLAQAARISPGAVVRLMRDAAYLFERITTL